MRKTIASVRSIYKLGIWKEDGTIEHFNGIATIFSKDYKKGEFPKEVAFPYSCDSKEELWNEVMKWKLLDEGKYGYKESLDYERIIVIEEIIFKK